MSATIPPERHNPKAWANYGCKDTIIFGEMQENGEKNAIFSLEDGASAYSLEFRGGRYPNIFGTINKERRGLLGLAKGGDDKGIQRTTGMRVGVGVTLDLLTIRIVACLPFGTLLGIVQNSGGLADTVAKALATC